jgi:SAM-dependent methyltransferase
MQTTLASITQGGTMAAQQKLGQAYDTSFYDHISDGSRTSAAIVLPLVRGLATPASVLDVGCGVGAWLAEWVALGVTDVIGLDGSYVDQGQLQIPAETFIPTDLTQPYGLDREFDLIQCLEVAEHIDVRHADTFVESITRHGRIVLFSAAIPGQRGRHHVNEQWPSYWIAKFAKFGFTAYDAIRPQIWTNDGVQAWYRQNIILFSKDKKFDGAESRFDVVHPEVWNAAIEREKHPLELLRSMPAAMSELLQKKSNH